MAIKKSQLYSTLWESCNALRGSMDASQYKDYVLIILFVKYLSDKAGQKGFRLRMPSGCHFSDFVALKQSPNIGEEINIKLHSIVEENALYFGEGFNIPNFNDPDKFGKGKSAVDSLSRLIAVFENDALDFSHNRAADDDILGDAYEYLMKNFAVESGKSKGQFYTPAEVSRVIAKVVRVDELNRADQIIYDPTCGSGSLLLRAHDEASNFRVSLRGQEKDSSTATLAKLNMFLHGVTNMDIQLGDTIRDPRFTISGHLKTFDVCIANPPFSQKDWMPSDMPIDPYNRWFPTLTPPSKCGDYAFLLHLIASMNPDDGRGACILPHGVLFRGNAEYNIRKDLIQRHIIKGIIGLPPNIFFGTGIPAAIIVIDKKNKALRQGIFFIDAKDGFAKDGAKNRLREQDIKRIVDAWNLQQDIPHYCRLASWSEIENNDFNLNIPRYIQPADNEIHHDIYAHLHSGLPIADIDKMTPYWLACPSLRYALFSTPHNGYASLIPAKNDIKDVILHNDSYQAQCQAFANVLNDWRNDILPHMLNINKGDNPKTLISQWADTLLSKLKAHNSLVDPYDAYDVLLNYWANTMQDDCYMISNDGWTIPTVKATKSNKKGTKELPCAYNEIICDLLPVDILLGAYFSSETSQIDNLTAQTDTLQTQMDNLAAANPDAFYFAESDDDAPDNIKVKAADVRKAIKNNKNNPQTLKPLNDYLDLYNTKEQLSKQIKQLNDNLATAIINRYNTLSADDIKNLVVNHKWLPAISSGCQQLMLNVTHQISAQVSDLVSRYETPLSTLSLQAKQYENEVNNLLAQMGFNI